MDTASFAPNCPLLTAGGAAVDAVLRLLVRLLRETVALHGSDATSRRVNLKSPFTRIFHDLHGMASLQDARRFEGEHVVYVQPAVGVSSKSPVKRAMSAHVHQELAESHKLGMGLPSGRHGYGLHDPILRACCTI